MVPTYSGFYFMQRLNNSTNPTELIPPISGIITPLRLAVFRCRTGCFSITLCFSSIDREFSGCPFFLELNHTWSNHRLESNDLVFHDILDRLRIFD